MAVVVPSRPLTEVWDPEVFAYESVPSLNANQTWLSSGYRVPPGEVVEVYSVEVIPPVDTTTNTVKRALIEVLVNSEPVDGLKLSTLMAPYRQPQLPSAALWLGKPLLHRPLTGALPAPHEATAVKAKEGDLVQLRVTALETLPGFTVVWRMARCRGQSKLREVVGVDYYPVAFTLDGDTYTKPPVPVTVSEWDALPGGRRQAKPAIFAWRTFATNSKATTPNTWYSFEYPYGVASDWMNLSWNLVGKDKAYYLTHAGVQTHSNAKAIRFYVEGRPTNPEWPIRPLPEPNEFLPALFVDNSLNEQLRWSGPGKLPAPWLAHGVNAAIQVIDNGTPIPAGGIEIEVYGTLFVLK